LQRNIDCLIRAEASCGLKTFRDQVTNHD
jgi:hypothetical protein